MLACPPIFALTLVIAAFLGRGGMAAETAPTPPSACGAIGARPTVVAVRSKVPSDGVVVKRMPRGIPRAFHPRSLSATRMTAVKAGESRLEPLRLPLGSLRAVTIQDDELDATDEPEDGDPDRPGDAIGASRVRSVAPSAWIVASEIEFGLAPTGTISHGPCLAPRGTFRIESLCRFLC